MNVKKNSNTLFSQKDLTSGPVFSSMFFFALPMILGNLLQQGYNIVDTWVVGHYVGLYTYDFPYFSFAWPLYGKRDCIFSLFWQAR